MGGCAYVGGAVILGRNMLIGYKCLHRVVSSELISRIINKPRTI